MRITRLTFSDKRSLTVHLGVMTSLRHGDTCIADTVNEEAPPPLCWDLTLC